MAVTGLRRRMVSTIAAGGLVAGTVLAVAPAAYAATDFAELQDALRGECQDTVALTGNINEPGNTLGVSCDVTLDLAGFDLAVQSINIEAGSELTIDDTGEGGALTANASSQSETAGINYTGAALVIDGGTVNASGGGQGAGIGGGYYGHGGEVTINDGDVTATGGNQGAGIGGGFYGHGGEVVINGGIVDAQGGNYAAGIGGGSGGDGGEATIAGGAVEATSGGYGAGIGGGYFGDGGEITITGGDVTATGGNESSGMGGGYDGDGGEIVITGGTVTATGGNQGAGIGGGTNASASEITISGGEVTATGGRWGAGVGGGYRGDGGEVTIGAQATVTARGGEDASAIGRGLDGEDFGSLEIGGDMYLPEGFLEVPDGADVSIEDTGRILGADDAQNATNGADIVGGGQIDNAGVIALDASGVDVDVVGHHYQVAFDPAGGTPGSIDPVTVFADSFDAGFRDFPDNPTRPGSEFAGWAHPPATDLVDQDTPLNALLGQSEDGDPVAIEVDALFADYNLGTSLDGDPFTMTAGQEDSFTAELRLGEEPAEAAPGQWDITTADGDAPLVTDIDSGEVSLSGEVAGDYDLTITYIHADLGVDLAETVAVSVQAGPLARLDVTPSATQVAEGETVTLQVAGFDEFGNDVGDIDDDLVVTSDVDTDIIDALIVSFPAASDHTLTVTHEPTGTTAQVVITVTPAPVQEPDDETPEDEVPGGEGPEDEGPRDEVSEDEAPGEVSPVQDSEQEALPETGASTAPLLWLALGLLVIGGALYVMRFRTARE